MCREKNCQSLTLYMCSFGVGLFCSKTKNDDLFTSVSYEIVIIWQCLYPPDILITFFSSDYMVTGASGIKIHTMHHFQQFTCKKNATYNLPLSFQLVALVPELPSNLQVLYASLSHHLTGFFFFYLK